MIDQVSRVRTVGYSIWSKFQRTQPVLKHFPCTDGRLVSQCSVNRLEFGLEVITDQKFAVFKSIATRRIGCE